MGTDKDVFYSNYASMINVASMGKTREEQIALVVAAFAVRRSEEMLCSAQEVFMYIQEYNIVPLAKYIVTMYNRYERKRK